MSSAKSERLMNLLIALLVARQPITKEKLREAVTDYHGSSDEAFEKKFERDKEDLRDLGVPIVVEPTDKLFEDELGYRIRRDEMELPPIELSAEEAAVVGLAARTWQHAGLAQEATRALRKLAAGGVEVDRAELDIIAPAVAVADPSFEPLWSATAAGIPVAFGYRKSGSREIGLRTLEPWGVVTARGHWYVVGFDRDREAPRLFRLSRIVGEVSQIGPAGSVVVPPGTDIRALTRSLAPVPKSQEATLAIVPGRAHELRRLAEPLAYDPAGLGYDPAVLGCAPAGLGNAPAVLGCAPAGHDVVRIGYGDEAEFATHLVGYADAVTVLGPDTLRAAVIANLQAIVAAAS